MVFSHNYRETSQEAVPNGKWSINFLWPLDVPWYLTSYLWSDYQMNSFCSILHETGHIRLFLSTGPITMRLIIVTTNVGYHWSMALANSTSELFLYQYFSINHNPTLHPKRVPSNNQTLFEDRGVPGSRFIENIDLLLFGLSSQVPRRNVG